MEERGYIDLLTLQEYTAAAVSDAFPDVLWVKAEISSVSVKSNGHCYLELSQSDEGGTLVAKARAVIWRSRYSTLLKSFIEQTGQAPEAGMEVLLQVQVSFSPLWGLTLTVEDIDGAYVLGQRELQKRQTLERLASEGLLDMQKELCLPVLPYRLAVISAEGAAGWGDFRKHLLENEYGFVLRAELFEATMQGASAPASIISALETICETGCGHKASGPVAARGHMNGRGPTIGWEGWSEAEGNGSLMPAPVDAVLILRGGGSELDLACFDDYELAAAIARCPIPVVTAIGHERDFHVADMVANTYVKTPTALADLFLDCYIAEDQRISTLESSLRASYTARIGAMELRLGAARDALLTAARGRFANAEAKLGVLEARLAAADPAEVLRRGFSLVTDSAGVRMTSVKGRKKGDAVSVRLSDGRLDCTVTDIHPS
ncbi:MAG: exodeoxyribonuclease VII large subunit [Bacteroidales bacterium]|nr:exodeoxyribonuclease VII large subunit [Bacteroidales bacterium]